jgi:hypothetical protein
VWKAFGWIKEYGFLIGGRFPFHGMSFTDFCLAQFEFEVRHAVREGILTEGKASPFDRPRAGADYRELRSLFQLYNNKAISRAILWMVLGFECCRTILGVLFTYLSGRDREQFWDVAWERTGGINYITKSEALEIAFDFHEKRILRAVYTLILTGGSSISSREVVVGQWRHIRWIVCR